MSTTFIKNQLLRLIGCIYIANAYAIEPFFIPHAIVSAYAVNLENGAVIANFNSDLSLTPASCLKLVTTGAALHLLGTQHRFVTTLEYDGIIDDKGILNGNLYIKGGGDPCLGTPTPNLLIKSCVQAINDLGIKQIKGKVVGDASQWESAMAPPTWCWEDLGNYYGAGACALSICENTYKIVFKTGKYVGDPVTVVRTEPDMEQIHFNNGVRTGPEGSGDCACIYGAEYTELRDLRGTVPLGFDEFTIKGSIPDPALFCATLLEKSLKTAGIEIGNTIKPTDLKRVSFYKIYSPTVQEIVTETNQRSQNLYAEHLLKAMGGGTTSGGIQAVTKFWLSQGIDSGGLKLADGSGLSRLNLITTKQLVQILVKMDQSPYSQSFKDSLPMVMEGIRAKSGSMSHVKGYVGYTETVAFAVIVNNCTNTKEASEAIDKLLLNFKSVK